MAPHFFDHHDSPSNLAKSRYPPWYPLLWGGYRVSLGCRDRGQSWPMLSAIDVTVKTFFERLYLVVGLDTFGTWVNCPCAPTTPTVHITNVSQFPCNFFPEWALIFWIITIHQVLWPSTLLLVGYFWHVCHVEKKLYPLGTSQRKKHARGVPVTSAHQWSGWQNWLQTRVLEWRQWFLRGTH